MDDYRRKEAGHQGEVAALRYLSQRGLQLIARNYRCRVGELDLVMLDGNTLALIEVRYRGNARFGGPAASVTARKQHRLAMAAQHLLACRKELRRFPARFDVVAISPATNGLKIEWIKAAFSL